MFLGLPEKKHHYMDPWWTTFEDRASQLNRGGRKLVYFYERPDSSTFRYRVYNMIESINSTDNGFAAAHFTRDDLPAMERIIKRASALILCRVSYSDAIAQLIMMAKAANCKVFYDVDDLIYDLDLVAMIMETLSEKPIERVLNTYYAYVSRLGAVLKMCDEAIVTNEHLAKRVQEFTHKPVHVVCNFMNNAQIAYSEELFQQKVSNEFGRDESLHIGYFSGSPTHNQDFQLAVPALVNLMERYRNIKLRLVGYLDSPNLEHYESRIERLPMMDFLNLQLAQAKTEINIVPLQDNVFTNSKSDLKYFETGIVGTVSVASPVFAYKQSITDGVNGFLSDDQSWEEKIENIIANFDTTYTTIAKTAFNDCRERYSPAAQQKVILRVFS
ncbi:MAG TPA: glycosyltransferase [Oculatellaceae cyanobacterium]